MRVWSWLKLMWHSWKLAGVLTSPSADAARKAVAKVAADRSFHPTKQHTKKCLEAREWASVYLTDRANTETPWEINFAIEYELGQRKGRL